MASTGVRLGHGTVVRIGRGATPTWTTLTGVEDLTFPDQARGDEDVTSMDSPNETEEHIQSLRAAADWSMTKHFVPEDAEDVLLNSLEASGETVQLEITPAGSLVPRRWRCYVKNWLPTMPVKGAMKATLTLKVMAKIVVTPPVTP